MVACKVEVRISTTVACTGLKRSKRHGTTNQTQCCVGLKDKGTFDAHSGLAQSQWSCGGCCMVHDLRHEVFGNIQHTVNHQKHLPFLPPKIRVSSADKVDSSDQVINAVLHVFEGPRDSSEELFADGGECLEMLRPLLNMMQHLLRKHKTWGDHWNWGKQSGIMGSDRMPIFDQDIVQELEVEQ
ncbi:hypothetical protein B0H19DRAFT_1066140 [Mycena capillaripes]|nr:hypothetical protein B0H19DRAFT_1066140 [Mycena capillaripes]